MDYNVSACVFIYGLFDPRTLELRYIGKAKNIQNRLSRHIYDAKKTTANHKNAWIKGLLNDGLKPAIEILEECTKDDWQDIERQWISDCREFGVRLLNRTKGGEGVSGYKYSDEQRRQMSKRRKGRSITESHRQALIQSNKTRIVSDETKQKMSRAKKGKPSPITGIKRSKETKQKIRDAKLGTRASEETKQKMRENNRGVGNPMYGKTHTKEARERIRQAQLGRKHTDEHRLKNSLGLKKAYREEKR